MVRASRLHTAKPKALGQAVICVQLSIPIHIGAKNRGLKLATHSLAPVHNERMSTSVAEVTNISRHGVWVLVDERELFMPFEDFPWFRNASINSVLKLERPQPHHLYWPELDIDLTVDSIENPEKYPLKSKGRA